MRKSFTKKPIEMPNRKSKDLKKMLTKSAVSNTWAGTFENFDHFWKFRAL